MKDNLSQVIVNIEAQKAEPSAYDIINRAVFYVSRMISSQKGREFIKSNYNDIKRVYSIWVCMNMSQNCMNYIHFTQESVVGTYQWKGDIDLANIVLIGLAEDLPEKNSPYHSCVSKSLPRDAAHNQKVSDYWLLQFLQYCK